MHDVKMITGEQIQGYLHMLREQERADQTIKKYAHDLSALAMWLNGRELNKENLIIWKQYLITRYAAASVNAMLTAINGFLSFTGYSELKVRPVKIQRQIFCSTEKELTKAEYFRLIAAAKKKGNERLALVIQTICGTGIRVSELQFITAEAVRTGRAEVFCKGKRRSILLPKDLRKSLTTYLRVKKRTAGPVFLTKTGKPLDRSNIWRDMKALCKNAGVAPAKVFPHNLRHLFARTYYSLEKDILRLSDILGHSNITTTRIYTMESGHVHEQQLNKMGLVALATT